MIKRATNPRLHKRTFEYTMCFGFKWWILLLNAIVAKNREFCLFHNRTGYFLRNMLCFPKKQNWRAYETAFWIYDGGVKKCFSYVLFCDKAF